VDVSCQFLAGAALLPKKEPGWKAVNLGVGVDAVVKKIIYALRESNPDHSYPSHYAEEFFHISLYLFDIYKTL
jgi:hypothetical protein